MTEKCDHPDVAWFNSKDGWTEHDAPSRGTWRCSACTEEVIYPMGSGVCPTCRKPLDDHQLMASKVPQCVTA